jgi:hypothetical protein
MPGMPQASPKNESLQRGRYELCVRFCNLIILVERHMNG